ncbi:MAG: ribonuclease III domain-containing protein [Candidatus Gastranaerophilales bacterium]|nr:ribonuclease III domain-containing protein [Candidatus Gastranaerophilales bacterium]
MPKNLPIRSLAHIGDGVYEVFAREITIYKTENANKLHKMTVSIVNAEFQAFLLNEIENFLTEEEKEIIRRARNLSVTTARRTNQKLHRLSTAFEALIGYLYLSDKKRLEQIFEKITPIACEKIGSELNT